jgi:hypothetical protein
MFKDWSVAVSLYLFGLVATRLLFDVLSLLTIWRPRVRRRAAPVLWNIDAPSKYTETVRDVLV